MKEIVPAPGIEPGTNRYMDTFTVTCAMLPWGVMVWVLGVRVPTCSLFHDVKLAFFDFWVRGSPKILKILLGVPTKMLKKIGVFPVTSKGFFLRREAASAGRRFAAPRPPPLRGTGKTPCRHQGKPPIFFNILGGTHNKIFKI